MPGHYWADNQWSGAEREWRGFCCSANWVWREGKNKCPLWNIWRFFFPGHIDSWLPFSITLHEAGPRAWGRAGMVYEGHPQPPQGMHQTCVFLAQTTCLCSWCTCSRLQTTQGTSETSGSWSYRTMLPRAETHSAAVTRHFLKTLGSQLRAV